MTPDREDDEPTQTTPAGAEIPVPDREDVMDAFRKVAQGSRREDATPDTTDQR